MNRTPVKFVGRSRRTDQWGDDPRERRVLMSDGTELWAEEGSLLWDQCVEVMSRDHRQRGA